MRRCRLMDLLVLISAEVRPHHDEILSKVKFPVCSSRRSRERGVQPRGAQRHPAHERRRRDGERRPFPPRLPAPGSTILSFAISFEASRSTVPSSPRAEMHPHRERVAHGAHADGTGECE